MMCEEKPMSKQQFAVTVIGFYTKFMRTAFMNVVVGVIGIFVGMGIMALHVRPMHSTGAEIA